MEFGKEELRTIYRALKIAKQGTELSERPSKSENMDNAEYKAIMDKIEEEFNL